MFSYAPWQGEQRGRNGGDERGELRVEVVDLEGALDVRAQAHRPGGALADVDAAALPGDDQALLAQHPHGLLHGHPGHAVSLGEFVAGGQLLAGGDLAGEDRGAQSYVACVPDDTSAKSNL